MAANVTPSPSLARDRTYIPRVPLLRLTTDEAHELKLALEVRLHALRVELTSTDTLDYRALLRDRLDRLESISARLDEDGESADRPHDS
jgi:hypothetical protein